MADKDFSVEGRITRLDQTSTSRGIETTIGLEPSRDPNQIKSIVFPGPTGLRRGDYISASGHEVVDHDHGPMGVAENVYHRKNKRSHEILESYEIGL